VVIGYLDGRIVKYPIRPRTEMQYERSFKVGLNRLGEGNEGVNNVYKLAWLVQKENVNDFPGGILPDFEKWADTVDGIEMTKEPILPFDATAAADGSHNSA